VTADRTSRLPLARAVATRLSTAAWNSFWWWQAVPRCAAAWVRDAGGRRRYRELSERELIATRRSDTAFIFGSGYSLNAITPDQWRAISRCAVLSFREFPRQSFVRADYHLTGEVDFLDEYAMRLRENALYRDAVFVVQEGWRAFNGNNLVGRHLLPDGARVFRYRRTARGRMADPSRTFADGLVHGFGSVFPVTNLAYLMGFRRIVLAGIDLNDKRYFWLASDELRAYEKPGLAVDSVFTGADDIVALMGRWRALFESEGVSLLVFNPRSRLAGALPVFAFEPSELL
jgi:hypothetical protein